MDDRRPPTPFVIFATERRGSPVVTSRLGSRHAVDTSVVGVPDPDASFTTKLTTINAGLLDR